MATELTKYIEDDWDDNSLANRSASEKGLFYQYGDGGTGDLLKGVYRPQWNTVLGSPIATNQEWQNNTSNGSAEVQTPSNWTTGSFAYDAKISEDVARPYHIQHSQIRENDNNYIRIDLQYGSNALTLQKAEAGISSDILTASISNFTSYHRVHMDRSSYGNFEVFYRGSSKGTANESFLPDPKYIQLRSRNSTENTTNPTHYTDNLTIQ